MTESERIAALLQDIGESVEIYYEPRNEGMEWYVGFADPHGEALPVHEHFDTLIGGLMWLSRNGKGLLPRDRAVRTSPQPTRSRRQPSP